MWKKSVRILNENDELKVIDLDNLSNNYVADWIDSEMAYGLFHENELVGYLTLGYADECGDVIENHPKHTYDSYILSNVFIKPEFRNKGLARYMIEEALKDIDEEVFLTIVEDDLENFYIGLGFETIGENCMIKVN